MEKEKKILSFTGGGVKGIIQMSFLKKLEEKLNINNKNENKYKHSWIIDNIDGLCGTSVGSLLVVIILLNYPIDIALIEFEKSCKKIFIQSKIQSIVGDQLFALFSSPYKQKNLYKELERLIKFSPLNNDIKNGKYVIPGKKEINGNNFLLEDINYIYPHLEI